jgi:pimeloyl-ACP methyl ester carboxylesterase
MSDEARIPMPGCHAHRIRLATAVLLACLGLGPACSMAGDLPASGDAELSQTLEQLLGEDGAAAYAGVFRPGQVLSWDVYLPDTRSDQRPGVLVYVSPERSGRIVSRWRAVMDEHNLIYIAARDSGNNVPVKTRVTLAVLALKALEAHRNLDENRLYVAGFSGGGRVASVLGTRFGSLFHGALYICGVDFWKSGTAPDEASLRNNRFVFMTGSGDFNRRETKQVYREYVNAGAARSKLIEVTGMGHEVPYASDLDDAMRFLEGEGEAID